MNIEKALKKLEAMTELFTQLRIEALQARDFEADEDLKTLTDNLGEIRLLLTGKPEKKVELPLAPEQKPRRGRKPGVKPAPKPEGRRGGRRAKTLYPAGTILFAEYKGKRLEATATNAGFQYAGQEYASISALGKAVVGGKPSHLQQAKYWKVAGAGVPEAPAKRKPGRPPKATKVAPAKPGHKPGRKPGRPPKTEKVAAEETPAASAPAVEVVKE